MVITSQYMHITPSMLHTLNWYSDYVNYFSVKPGEKKQIKREGQSGNSQKMKCIEQAGDLGFKKTASFYNVPLANLKEVNASDLYLNHLGGCAEWIGTNRCPQGAGEFPAVFPICKETWK